MAQATHNNIHPISQSQPRNARRRIGKADLAFKAQEAEVKALKDEFKSRGLFTAAGEHFTVTRSDQISSRLDVAAVKQYLGDAWRRFETRTSPPSSASRPAAPRARGLALATLAFGARGGNAASTSSNSTNPPDGATNDQDTH